MNVIESIFFLGVCCVVGVSAESSATELLAGTLKPLPPSWTSGGGATVEKLHSKNAQKKHAAPEGEAEFSSTSLKAQRHILGAFGSLPELARLDYRYSVSPFFALTLGASAPMPIEVDIAMPSDLIKADPAKGLAVAYPAFDIKFKIDWGPHVYLGTVWHPFGGTWYSSAGLGVRSIRIKGHAVSPIRVCSLVEAAKEPPCGNDAAAIQTRSQLSIKSDVKLLSYTMRAATGWLLPISPSWILLAEAGLFAPLSTKENTKILAELIAPDGNSEDLSGALGELRTKSEVDLKAKAKSELSKYTNQILPVVGVGLAYRF